MKKNRDTTGGIVYSSGRGRMCPGCSRPIEECICVRETPARPVDRVVRVRRESKGRGGKTVTVISGVPLDAEGIRVLAGDLKRLIGTGGAIRENTIEIQGDQVERIMVELKSRGFTVKRAGG